MRIFNNDSLYPSTANLAQEVSGEGESVYVSESLRAVMELDESKSTPPFFLVGDLPVEIIDVLGDDLDEDNPLIIKNMYPEAIQSQFQSGDFAVDSGAKPAGYITNIID